MRATHNERYGSFGDLRIVRLTLLFSMAIQAEHQGKHPGAQWANGRQCNWEQSDHEAA